MYACIYVSITISSFQFQGPGGKVKLCYVRYDIVQGGPKPCILKLKSVFHHFSSVGPKQLCLLAYLGFTPEAGTVASRNN